MIDANTALQWSTWLAAIAIALLDLEILSNSKATRIARCLAACQLVVLAIALFWPSVAAFAVLALTLYAISTLHSGAYCGGSDAYLLYSVIALGLGQRWPDLGVAILGVFAALSYLVSGWVKVGNLRWWTGDALRDLLSSTFYNVPVSLRRLSGKKYLMRALSWGLLFWELGFVFALFFTETRVLFLALGFVFHLGVFYTFGLNRFFWVWIVSYPALLRL